MRVLELFKGTGSVGKCIKEYYPDAEVISLDILKKFNPTICVDILEWDYKQFPRGHFDLIWGSPECKIYSNLQYTLIGRKWKDRAELDEARLEHSKFVRKVLEIIDYFQPKRWYIENPYYSTMRNLACMEGINSNRFDYCRFGYLYKKPTRIWSNRTNLTDMICNCVGIHKMKIGITSKDLLKEGQIADTSTIKQRYSIPPDLMKLLLVEDIYNINELYNNAECLDGLSTQMGEGA
tara:strand:- start:6135 stop:6842 length:708 start_codon:yes stop_codon:yes gene_type:complete